MGIYDREYYRDENEPQGFHVGGKRMMVTNIAIFTVAIFALDSFTGVTETLLEFKKGKETRTVGVDTRNVDAAIKEAKGEGFSLEEQSIMSRWLSGHMTLRSNLAEKPWNVWQLLTYGFAHAPL